MSSSSSLAAARRRRAGGVNQPPGRGPIPPTPGRGPPPQQQNNSVTETQSIPPNPLMILQQHHVKINMLDSLVNKLMSEKEFNRENNNVETFNNTNEINQTQFKFDLNEVTNVIMSKIEEQFDFKVFYDNDEKLGSEIENLNRVVLEQQTTLNSLNKLLYLMISNLKLEVNDEKINSETESQEDDNNVELIVGDSDDLKESIEPTFPKTVKIDLDANEKEEFNPIDEDQEDDGSKYEAGTEFTEDGLAIPPVD